MEQVIPLLVYSLAHERFIGRHGETWDIAKPYGKQSAIAFLVDQGLSYFDAKYFVNAPEGQLVVHGADLYPGQPPLFIDPETGWRMMNLWTPPTLVPAPGEFPTIRMVQNHLTAGDAEALRYMDHSFARKVQDLNVLPKVALVIATSQGAGKGFMFRVLSEILGPKNCAVVTQGELESNFSGKYARCLAILGDEVVSSENLRDISQKLKVLIDGGEIDLERKFENRVSIRNRTFWMFASNSQVAPLHLESSDRRYTFFSNFAPVEKQYADAMNACFEKDRKTITPAFRAEIAAYAHYLLGLEVDVPFVIRPYFNSARAQLVEAGLPSNEAFCREVEEHGFDAVVREARKENYNLDEADPSGKEWDFGPKVSRAFVFRVYEAWCEAAGMRGLGRNKFISGVRNSRPHWDCEFHTVREAGKEARRVNCFSVPRHAREPAPQAPETPEECKK